MLLSDVFGWSQYGEAWLGLCKPATAAGIGEGAQKFFKHLTNNYTSFKAIPYETEEGNPSN
jgi:hypothetical protein